MGQRKITFAIPAGSGDFATGVIVCRPDNSAGSPDIVGALQITIVSLPTAGVIVVDKLKIAGNPATDADWMLHKTLDATGVQNILAFSGWPGVRIRGKSGGTLGDAEIHAAWTTGSAAASEGAGLPAALGAGGGLKVDGSGVPLPIGNLSTSIAVTPALDTAAYATGDSLHTAVMEFANAARVSGGSGIIEKLVIVDAAVQSAAGELWLFSATVTPAAANAAHSISDADAALCIGVIPFGPYYASALNSVSVAKGLNLAFKVAGTSLFGILVTRGTPTYAAGSLTVSLLISQD